MDEFCFFWLFCFVVYSDNCYGDWLWMSMMSFVLMRLLLWCIRIGLNVVLFSFFDFFIGLLKFVK